MNRYINVSEDAIKGVFKKLNHKNIYPKASDEIILRNYLDEFPTANVREVDAPKTYSEQLNLDCEFCRCHEQGDTLYNWSDWDGGIGFDYIRDIKFCPICGRELFIEERED